MRGDPLRICHGDLRRRGRSCGARLLVRTAGEPDTGAYPCGLGVIPWRNGQMLPTYSAKKIAGVPSYKLAREGKSVELKPAKVRIDRFVISGIEGSEATFEMSISAGGYVRSVAHELGQDLGCGAHLSQLRRTGAGAFTLAEAHTLEELAELAGNTAGLESCFVHPRTFLPEMPGSHR